MVASYEADHEKLQQEYQQQINAIDQIFMPRFRQLEEDFEHHTQELQHHYDETWYDRHDAEDEYHQLMEQREQMYHNSEL